MRNCWRILIAAITTATMLLSTVAPVSAATCVCLESEHGQSALSPGACCCCRNQHSGQGNVHQGSCCRAANSSSQDERQDAVCTCHVRHQQPLSPESARRNSASVNPLWMVLPPATQDRLIASGRPQFSGETQFPRTLCTTFAQKVYCIWLT